MNRLKAQEGTLLRALDDFTEARIELYKVLAKELRIYDILDFLEIYLNRRING